VECGTSPLPFQFGLALVKRTARWTAVGRYLPGSGFGEAAAATVLLSGNGVQRCYANNRAMISASSEESRSGYLSHFARGGGQLPHDTGAAPRWPPTLSLTTSALFIYSIRIINRLNFFSGYGWAGANMVIWNSGRPLPEQSPPTAQLGHGNVGDVEEPPSEEIPPSSSPTNRSEPERSATSPNCASASAMVRSISAGWMTANDRIRPELWE